MPLIVHVHDYVHDHVQFGICTQINMQEPEVVTAALAAYCDHPTLGFSDCLSAALARKSGHVPLGTFDEGLTKLVDTQRLSK